jgi:hypothetical protein
MVTHYIECSDTTLRVYLRWNRSLVQCLLNSDGKVVYTRYVGEQHVKEDCYNYIPSAKEWIQAIESKEKPVWMIRTLDINVD